MNPGKQIRMNSIFRKSNGRSVIIAMDHGGLKADNVKDTFQDVHDSLQAGAAGITIGRNIWQNNNTKAIVEAMAGLVHEECSVKQALDHL